MRNEEGKNTESNTQLNEEEQCKQAQNYMFQMQYNYKTNQIVKVMFPFYKNYFIGYLGMIKQMKTTLDSKWSDQQLEKYQLFLTDLDQYIRKFVFPGYVDDFRGFIDAINKYGQTVNPIGYQLYNHQLQYLEMKAEGKNYRLQKKKEKTCKNISVKPEKEKPKQNKEQKTIRKDDPTISTVQLTSKKMDEEKYSVDMTSFRKQNGNLIFIGHVDSGKSTLTGNLMKQLREIDEQELVRNRQEAKDNHMEAWQLAFIGDIDQSERKRGKTVEYSKMMFNLENRRFTVFDAPGHKNYVPNMIMGACQADIAVLIISAKQGQFQSGFEKQGQTKEHAMLATALGVQNIIAVVSKMETINWSQERFNIIKNQVSNFLQKYCGFSNVPFIPIDSIANINIHSQIKNSWYQDKCLLEILNTVKLPQRNSDGPLRIPIIDKYKDAGNLFLYGKIQSGKITCENQIVSLLPRRSYCYIKQIFNAKDQKIPYALAGENVKLRVKGIEDDQVCRGNMICSNSNYCQESMQFKADLTTLLVGKQIISSGYKCMIHMHAISEEIQIKSVEGKFVRKQDKEKEESQGLKASDDNEKIIKSTFLKAGENGKVIIKLNYPICLEKFDFMPTLGRFTLRDEGKTIAYGQIRKIKPAKPLLKEQKEQI